jgi:hypothetical protein
MNVTIATLWADALSSYEQGQDRLRRDNTYCPLGVLCNEHSKATGMPWTLQDGYYTYLGERVLLPPAVVDWAGFEEHEIIRYQLYSSINVRLGGTTVPLLGYARYTFPEIAELIREEL